VRVESVTRSIRAPRYPTNRTLIDVGRRLPLSPAVSPEYREEGVRQTKTPGLMVTPGVSD
jgi:hypothetical protein